MGVASSKPKRPMDGIRVLDAATFLAGPLCATIMGEFGAEVIKLEQPKIGDPMRSIGMRAKNDESLTWLSEARNKKTITLNLSDPKGAALFKVLAREADVVVENFRPGTMERWGLGYEALKAVNPKLVMARVTAYGQDGPYKDRPGFARIAHAVSGLTFLAGDPDGPPVVPGSTSLADYMSGLYTTIGVLMALRYRDATGLGQFVDMALYESTFRVLDEMVPAYDQHGFIRQRMGSEAPTIVPHSHYKCADGEWVALACSSDKIFGRLAKAMGRPEMAQPDTFATMRSRVANRDEINKTVSAWINQYSRDEVMDICLKEEIPCGPINSVADIFKDPQFKARGNLLEIEDADVGRIVVPAVFPKLSLTPGHVDHLGRRLGQDNNDVYRSLAGLSESEINDLKSQGVI